MIRCQHHNHRPTDGSIFLTRFDKDSWSGKQQELTLDSRAASPTGKNCAGLIAHRCPCIPYNPQNANPAAAVRNAVVATEENTRCNSQSAADRECWRGIRLSSLKQPNLTFSMDNPSPGNTEALPNREFIRTVAVHKQRFLLIQQ